MGKKKIAAVSAALAAGGFIAMQACSATFGYSPQGARLKRMQAAKNYRDGKFINELGTPKLTENQWKVSWKFFFGGSDRREPEKPPAIVKRKTADFTSPPATGLRVTWLGHSSFIIELDGQRILVDPVFGKRVSPFTWAGPARFHGNPITLKDLPRIDVVVISHDHYDHLDYPSILKLKDRVPVFLVPLGVGAHLEGWGVPAKKIVELNWWQEKKIGSVRFVCTPARHFSGRRFSADEDATLWASWAVIGKTKRVFYSGDTGPMPGFTKIGEKLGPFDLTAIQLGAYGKFWPVIHMTPEEAMTAHRQLKGKLLLPVHWGTFDLALHAWDEPLIRTKSAAGKAGVPVIIPKPGEMVNVGER